MNRALAICVAMLVFGALSFGWTLSGTWTTELELLPDIEFVSTDLTLRVNHGGFDLTSVSGFGPAGYIKQSFSLSGSVAFVDVTGGMEFDPAAVEYKNAYLKIGADLFGVDMDMAWYHGTGWVVPAAWRTPAIFSLAHLEFLQPYESAVVFNVGFEPFQAQLVLLDRHQYVDRVVGYESTLFGIFEYTFRYRFPGSQLGWNPLTDGEDVVLEIYVEADSFVGLEEAYLAALEEILPVVLAALQAEFDEEWEGDDILIDVEMLDSDIVDFGYTSDVTSEEFVINAFQFHKFAVLMEALPLCCGLDFTIGLTFLKSGFDNLTVTVPNAFTFLGTPYTIEIKYQTHTKTATLIPGRPAPTVTVCPELFVVGTSVSGFGITCELDECNYIFFGTVGFVKTDWTMGLGINIDIGATPSPIGSYGFSYTFDQAVATRPAAFGLERGIVYSEEWQTLQAGSPYVAPVADWTLTAEDDWLVGILYDEFEVLKMGFCGPGCCGPDWEADFSIYWANFVEVTLLEGSTLAWDAATQTFTDDIEYTFETIYPTLFGVSRIAFSANIPIMENLAVNFAFSHFLIPNVVDPTSLTVGWTFTF